MVAAVFILVSEPFVTLLLSILVWLSPSLEWPHGSCLYTGLLQAQEEACCSLTIL